MNTIMKEGLIMKKVYDFFKKEWFPILLVVSGFVISICFYPSLPEKMPTHWNIRGEVDGYGSRFFGAFGLPFVNLGIYLLYVALPYIDPKRKNYEGFKTAYQLLKYVIVVFFFSFHLIILLNSTGVKIDIMAFIQVSMSLLFMIMGYAIVRVKHNYFIGIRTPWTLASEEVWIKTHSMSGRLWVMGGILNLILFLLGAKAISFFVIIIALSIIPVIYSYITYRKIMNEK